MDYRDGSSIDGSADSDTDDDFGFAEEFDEPDWAEEFNQVDEEESDEEESDEEESVVVRHVDLSEEVSGFGFRPDADAFPNELLPPVIVGMDSLSPCTLDTVVEEDEPEEDMIISHTIDVNDPVWLIDKENIFYEDDSDDKIDMDGINLGLRLSDLPSVGKDTNSFNSKPRLASLSESLNNSKAGWLRIFVQTGKRNPRNFKWKEKWCTLEHGRLRFQDSPNADINAKQTKLVDMSTVVSLSEDTTGKHPTRFVMETAGKGVKYYFEAVDVNECASWLATKRHAIDRAKRRWERQNFALVMQN